MEYEVVLWRIGYAGSSEGPYRLEEVFERLKERRWTGEVMVHARGRTDNWTPIEDVPEFAPLVAQLRGTYLGPGGDVQWRASADAQERGIQHEVWTEPESQLSVASQQGAAWNKAGIDVREDSFGFLSHQTPPAPRASMEPSPTLKQIIPPAPVPSLKVPPLSSPAAKSPQRIVTEGAQLPGFRTDFQIPVASSTIQAAAVPVRYEQTIPGPTELRSPSTRIVTGPPSRHSNSGIQVEEDGMSAFFAPTPSHTPPPPATIRQQPPAVPKPAIATQAQAPSAVRPISPAPSVVTPGQWVAEPNQLTTRIIEAPPSMPGIVVTEDHFDAFLP
jgi:hypothetical protein